MNTKLLRKIKKHILEEPKRLRMWGWVSKSRRSPCGTAACIGGWAVILSGKYSQEMNSDDIRKKAQRLLGFRGMKAARLFGPDFWPDQFHAGISGNGKKRTAEVAAKRIEHFIKTDGAE